MKQKTMRSVLALGVAAVLFTGCGTHNPTTDVNLRKERSASFQDLMVKDAAIEPVQTSMTASGAPWISVFLKGYWPQVLPAYWAITLFRWDINIRESSVLGLVGAGGLGMIMNAAIDTFQWDRVAVILLTIFAVVVIGEVVVTFFRRRLI